MLTEREFKNKLGLFVRKLRNRKGIASDKLSVDYTTVNQIENGHINPRAYTLYKILIDLDTDLDSLLTEKQREQKDLEDILIQKIRLLDDEKKKALIAFLNSFDITEK